MKKALIASIIMAAGISIGGQVGLPQESIALPPVDSGGSYLVCVWDESAQTWLQGFETYSHAGSYDFQLPEWGQWYWVGLWDENAGDYVFGKWIGHFVLQ
jgi:hypothetical protein